MRRVFDMTMIFLIVVTGIDSFAEAAHIENWSGSGYLRNKDFESLLHDTMKKGGRASPALLI